MLTKKNREIATTVFRYVKPNYKALTDLDDFCNEALRLQLDGVNSPAYMYRRLIDYLRTIQGRVTTERNNAHSPATIDEDRDAVYYDPDYMLADWLRDVLHEDEFDAIWHCCVIGWTLLEYGQSRGRCESWACLLVNRAKQKLRENFKNL